MSERDGPYTSMFGTQYIRLTAKRISMTADGVYRYMDIEFGTDQYLKIVIDPSTTKLIGPDGREMEFK